MPPSKDIDPARLALLNRGEIEARNLMETLAMDWEVLVPAALPRTLVRPVLDAIRANQPITRRMKAAGEALAQQEDPRRILAQLANHPSDTVRGWLCYLIGVLDLRHFPDYLDAIEPFADDPHYGVREWAWMAIRPHFARDVTGNIPHLTRWSHSPSANLRRFTTELTRPRGVWCLHIAELKTDPALALPLLEPLRADPTRYVQDSVANWLNDASKTRPDWVRALTTQWLTTPNPATGRICRRALRTLRFESV
jgi:3-methyladenine DNA glycosylase AlkC